LFISSAFGFGAEFANVSLRWRLTATLLTSQTPGLVISSKIAKKHSRNITAVALERETTKSTTTVFFDGQNFQAVACLAL